MKLSNVLLIFFFSGIIFVGVVTDVLAYSVTTNLPYSVVVDGHRYGGVNDRLHVNLFASAESNIFGVNGEYELQHLVGGQGGIGGGIIKKRRQTDKFSAAELDVDGLIDGEFYDYISTLLHLKKTAAKLMLLHREKGQVGAAIMPWILS